MRELRILRALDGHFHNLRDVNLQQNGDNVDLNISFVDHNLTDMRKYLLTKPNLNFDSIRLISS